MPRIVALLAAVAAGLHVLTGSGWAQNSFNVTAEVVPGCAITGSASTSGVDFGTLDFGTHPAVGAAVASASTLLSGGAIEIRCTPELALQVSVDAGLHATAGQRRLERNSAPADTVPYDLFATADHSAAFPTAGPVGVTVPSSGVLDLPIYGVVTLSGSGLLPGDYGDTVNITITW